jgi:hypothetical protein
MIDSALVKSLTTQVAIAGLHCRLKGKQGDGSQSRSLAG